MRIGFDARRYFLNKTGLGNYSREIVHALATEFPDDEFVLFHTEKKSPFVALPNLSVFTPGTQSKLWRTWGLAASAAEAGIAVFHGLSNEIPVGLAKKNIKSAVTIHDVIFKRYPGYYPLADRFIYNRKTKYALQNADEIIATSKATADDLVKYYGISPSLIHVVYQPVQAEFYEAPQNHVEHENPYFIYVSGFSDRKNHSTLIEAFSKIRNLTDWNLYLAGASGNTLDHVRKFIDHEKLNSRVRIFTDNASKDMAHLMKNASAFVYPSLFEGFGIPLAEAAVCHLPMAVSDISVFRELAGNSALYFHPNKADQMADAMLQLTQTEKTIPLVNQLSQVLEKINAKNIANKLMRLYRNAAETMG